MQIEDIKTWQWMIIGLLVGLLFGCVLLWKGPGYGAEGIDTIDQGMFERSLIGIPARGPLAGYVAQYRKDLPLVEELVVHPPASKEQAGIYWVTGDMYVIERERKNPKDLKSPIVMVSRWNRFKYLAKAPYQAVIGLPGQYHTVVDYLRALQKQPTAKFTFKLAWWDTPAVTLALPALAGVLMIGLAWPLALGLMQGVGIARPTKRKKVKLPKNRPVQATMPVDTSTGARQLDDLNAEMEKSLAGFASGQSVGDRDDDAGEVPIKPLTGTDGALPPNKDTQGKHEVREYGGEFYPVVKKVHKE